MNSPRRARAILTTIRGLLGPTGVPSRVERRGAISGRQNRVGPVVPRATLAYRRTGSVVRSAVSSRPLHGGNEGGEVGGHGGREVLGGGRGQRFGGAAEQAFLWWTIGQRRDSWDFVPDRCIDVLGGYNASMMPSAPRGGNIGGLEAELHGVGLQKRPPNSNARATRSR